MFSEEAESASELVAADPSKAALPNQLAVTKISRGIHSFEEAYVVFANRIYVNITHFPVGTVGNLISSTNVCRNSSLDLPFSQPPVCAWADAMLKRAIWKL